ncbi:MAG: hypothetical protein A2017_09255 [Lentisphaerae bacterium GWF2_44_16]|nr:MAG: hypothetical protein A2017_09255 [Lentisphaerae bacterium GWF2_44_16]
MNTNETTASMIEGQEASVPYLYTRRETAKLLRVSERTLDRLLKSGAIRVTKISNKALRIQATELSKYLQRQTEGVIA